MAYSSGGFRELLVWQRAHALALQVYRATAEFPREEAYGLSLQMRRSAVSVPANIAEGYGRQHTRDYIRFLTNGCGSLYELETYLLLSKDLGYLEDNAYRLLDDLRAETARLLTGLIRSLNRTQENQG